MNAAVHAVPPKYKEALLRTLLSSGGGVREAGGPVL